MTVLQREPGRTVSLEEGGSTVRKTFHGDDHTLLHQLAAREFERMAAFHEALVDVETATCPRPVELGLQPEPFLRMERAAGVRLQDHLAENVWRAEVYDQVAETLTQALTRYVKTFNEPYWDFILRNMFYDPTKHLVTFLDFGIPTIYEPILGELRGTAPLEVSLGGLLASSIFEAARPSRMARRREHRQAPVLARAVFNRCRDSAEGREISVEAVGKVARLTYDVAASGGGWMRQGWYRCMGPVLGGHSRLNRLCAVGRDTWVEPP